MLPSPLRHATLQASEIAPDQGEIDRDTDPEARQLLANDMKANGQIQAILVGEKNKDGKHPLYVGHRRYSALLIAQMPILAAIYPLLTAAQIRLLRLRENLGRKDYGAYELYERFTAVLADTPGMTQKQLATEVSYSPSLISQYLALNKCVPEIHEAVKAGKLWVSDIPRIAAAPAGAQVGMLNHRLQNGAAALSKKLRAPREDAVKLDRVRLVAGELSLTVCGKAMGLTELLAGLEDAVKQVGKAIRQQMDIRTLNAHTRAKAK